jgi:lysozyme
MQISFNGIQSLKTLEGFRKEAYKDTGGVWTIGYGTIRLNGKPVEQGMVVSEKEAELALQEDLSWAQTAVNQLVRVPLKQTMFDALVSFVYNIGENAFSKSTLLRKLNNKDYVGAGNEFTRWVFDNGKEVKGLVSRRLVEQAMFNS